MRTQPMALLLFVLALVPATWEQTSIPTFQYTVGGSSYTLVGGDPGKESTTTIPTVVVPIALSFGGNKGLTSLDGTSDIPRLKESPVFVPFPFGSGTTQYVDAMLRTKFPKAKTWHTLLGTPEVMKTVVINVPPGSGYLLTSKKTPGRLAIADIESVQKELSKQLPKQEGKLVIAVTHNTAYYTESDATLCCSWGTHGTDVASGNSFVLASYLSGAPSMVEDADVQPLMQQLGEFINDPRHNPLVREGSPDAPGNQFPAWLRPASMRPGDQGRCGGTRVSSAYFLLEPTDVNRKNNLPVSAPFSARTATSIYHLQNVALLAWYIGQSNGGHSADLGGTVSFPDPQALTEPAAPCPVRGQRWTEGLGPTTTAPVPLTGSSNGHELIGYWTGDGRPSSRFRLTDVSQQWDVIIIAFATPDKNDEGTLNFHTPTGYDPEQFKAEIATMKQRGKKVMISLGGGGQFFKLDDPKRIPNFVSSVSEIIRTYGFDGVDIDFETPSLVLDPDDTDFKHPTTPSILNLISGLRQLRNNFGPGFMISLVPEGSQMPAGFATYGGQFGSYLPIAYALRDILSFSDTQDYNTPPLQGLDGEIYQAGTVDYHAAMTELVLHGFQVGGDLSSFFPPLPGAKVAIGFLTGETSPPVVTQALDYIIRGKAPADAKYRLRKPAGYAGMIGAMFWTIDDDRREDYKFSNVVGPQLHGYAKSQ